MTALLRFFGWEPKVKHQPIKNAHYLGIHMANVQSSALR